MSMTPEEKFNHQIWEILQTIKGDYIAAGKNKPIEYEFPHVQGVGIIPQRRRKDIFYKLQEWKAIKIIEEASVGLSGGIPLIKYNVKQPKFNETYQKFQKSCDLTTYLNEYQNSQLDGSDLPDFGHIVDKKPRQTTKKKNKGKMFETGSGGGYYNRNHPIRPVKKPSAKEIVDGFSPLNYSFVLTVSEGIISAGEFGSEGEANYQLQSPPGQMLVQERQLLKKFEKLGLFRHLGEDGIFAIAKLRGIDNSILKQIVNEIKNRQTKTGEERSDLKTRYNQLIAEIRNSNKAGSGSEDLEKRYQKIINEIKSDTATRRGIEKKWDVLQAIWSLYEAHSRPDSVLVPVARLTIKNRSAELIDGIVEGLKKEEAFQEWERKDRYYNIQSINHDLLPEIYQEAGDTYKKLASEYQEEQKNDKQVLDLSPKMELRPAWQELNTPTTAQSTKEGVSSEGNTGNPVYNVISHTISFREKEIPIPSNSNQDSLCRVIFKNKSTIKKEWDNDEVLEKWGGHYDGKEVWRKVYNAGREVNKKVAIETGVKDFLIVKKLTVSLNPKYLK